LIHQSIQLMEEIFKLTQSKPNTFIVSLIQQYLNEHNLINTLSSLEEESNVPYGPTAVPMGSALETIISDFAELQKLNYLSKEDDLDKDDELWGETGDGNYIQINKIAIPGLHSKNLLCVRFPPDSNTSHLLAVSSANNYLKIVDYETKEVKNNIEGIHNGGIVILAYHPKNPNIILTGSMDGTHKIIDVSVRGGKVIQSFKDHGKFVTRVAFSSDGKLFATGSFDHTVNIYCIEEEEEKEEAEANTNLKYTLIKSFIFPKNVECILFDYDDTCLIISIREDNFLHYVKIMRTFSSTKSLSASFKFVEEKVNMNSFGDNHVSFSALDLCISPNGKYLLVATDTSRVILFALYTSKQIKNYYGSNNAQYSNPRVLWSANGKYIYGTSETREIVVWDVVSKQIVKKMKDAHEKVIRDMSANKDRSLLATCSYDLTVKIWQNNSDK